MTKKKLFKKVFYYFISICFITFMALCFSQNTGYLEYQNQKQARLTEKQIKQFEKDVAAGKQIDMKKYLKTSNKNYQNKLSSLGLKISKVTGNGVKLIVSKSFKFLEKLTN